MVIAVVALAVVVALLLAAHSSGIYDRIGEGGFDRDSQAPGGTSCAAASVRDEEIHQMLEARNARRAARGQEPLDVEAETERRLRDLGGG